MENFKPRFSPRLIELGIDKMTENERIQLIDDIWESIGPNETIPDWHLKLLEERIAHADANPGDRIPWEEALAELRKKS